MASAGSFLSYFGNELRLHRERAGLTQAEVGQRCYCGNGLISKIERAERVPQPETCSALDELFGTQGFFTRLGVEAREHSTRHRGFRAYLTVEPRAHAIHSYDSHLAPGLLQTEAYARALLQAERPAVGADELEARLALRMTRQDVLYRDQPSQLWAVLDESVLYREIGSTAVMAEQFGHILECASLPQVIVQVYPYTAGADPAYGQAFVIAELADGEGACHIDAPEGVGPYPDGGSLDRYRVIFDHLRASALSETDSLEVIARRVKELSES